MAGVGLTRSGLGFDLTMPTPNEYRHYARLCDKLAEDADDKIERAILRQMATQWRRLANRKIKQMRDPEEAKNSN